MCFCNRVSGVCGCWCCFCAAFLPVLGSLFSFGSFTGWSLVMRFCFSTKKMSASTPCIYCRVRDRAEIHLSIMFWASSWLDIPGTPPQRGIQEASQPDVDSSRVSPDSWNNDGGKKAKLTCPVPHWRSGGFMLSIPDSIYAWSRWSRGDKQTRLPAGPVQTRAETEPRLSLSLSNFI